MTPWIRRSYSFQIVFVCCSVMVSVELVSFGLQCLYYSQVLETTLFALLYHRLFLLLLQRWRIWMGIFWKIICWRPLKVDTQCGNSRKRDVQWNIVRGAYISHNDICRFPMGCAHSNEGRQIRPNFSENCMNTGNWSERGGRVQNFTMYTRHCGGFCILPALCFATPW